MQTAVMVGCGAMSEGWLRALQDINSSGKRVEIVGFVDLTQPRAAAAAVLDAVVETEKDGQVEISSFALQAADADVTPFSDKPRDAIFRNARLHSPHLSTIRESSLHVFADARCLH